MDSVSTVTPWRISCTYCGWSCRTSSYSLALDERDAHERQCPDCATVLERVA